MFRVVLFIHQQPLFHITAMLTERQGTAVSLGFSVQLSCFIHPVALSIC